MSSVRFLYLASAFVAALGASSCSKSVTHSAPAPGGLNAADTALATTCPDAIGETALKGKPALSVTHETVQTDLAGTLHYTATAGYLPVYAEGTQSGKIRACLFFFAYTRDDHAGDPSWPVTFLFNGGPGSPSDWLHLGGLGPKTLDLGDDGLKPQTGGVKDDRDTLLASSDLVFIDPINTGFSRPALSVDRDEFAGLQKDAASIGDFVSGFLTKFGRTASPKYLLGESYGGMRLPVLARYLDEKLGIKLAGFSLVSPWLDAMGDEVFDASLDVANDLVYLSYLPEFATIAWYHHKLQPDLQTLGVEEVFTQAQAYASGDYLKALAQGDDLTDPEKQLVVSQISRFSGLDPAVIEAGGGVRYQVDHFMGDILKDKGQFVSWYDGRLGAAETDPVNHDPSEVYDPFFKQAWNDYFLGSLGVYNPLEYASFYDYKAWPGANPSNSTSGEYLNVLSDLNTLFGHNPDLKAYIAVGLYDLTCPAAEAHFMLRHLEPAVAKRIQIGHYQGGHPVYFGATEHKKFSQALAQMIAAPKVIP